MLRRAVVWRLIRANPVSSIDRPSLIQPEMSVLAETEMQGSRTPTTSSSPRHPNPSGSGGRSEKPSC
jgi:hypothetical protein